MQPDFWLERWRNGQTGWHRDEVNNHLLEHWPTLGVPRGSRVFVPLCGKSLDLLWLAAQGYGVLGVELSRDAVESLFAENGLSPRVIEDPPFVRFRVDELDVLCGDFFDLTPEHLSNVDAVYDRASLIALPPADRKRYAEHLDRGLSDVVPRLLMTLEYDQTGKPGPPFSVGADEVDELFGRRHRIELLADLDILEESPRFREHGLDALRERIYRLARMIPQGSR